MTQDSVLRQRIRAGVHALAALLLGLAFAPSVSAAPTHANFDHLTTGFEHTQARGSCSTCHNGTMAQGKGPTHIVTDLECDACHTTLSWAGAMFTHVGVTSGCATCHDNVHATGPTANHIPIGTPMTACESCHSPTNYTNWLGATMNHLAVTALSCAGCHQTASFLGMHPSTD